MSETTATMATTAPLREQIDFILEIDRLKGVVRQTQLLDGSRHENSAEHSWHLAVMALVLSEHADEAVDEAHVVRLVLVHDLVEIDAGDAFCYDPEAVAGQEERERAAAKRIFGLLPEGQGGELRRLWEEFEARETAEAKFAHALDRLMPLLHNYNTRGGSWKRHGVHRDQVLARMAPVEDGSRRLHEFVQETIQDAVNQGFLPDKPSPEEPRE